VRERQRVRVQPARLASVVAGGAIALLAVPAVAEAEHIFKPGEYRGATGQGRKLNFAADHSGVHVFSTRMRLTCAGGGKRTVRFSVPHVHDLDDETGRFTYTRRVGARTVLRLTGTLAAGDARGTVSRRKGACASGTRRWTAEHRDAGGHGHHPPDSGDGTHGHGTGPMLHAGNRAPYPALERVSARSRRRADALRLATNREAARFATVAMAERAGYVADPAISPIYVPGLVHYRKNGPSFWGRVLDPTAPQALIFWCPSAGECSLAAFLYRAPAKPLPPTYGHIIGWHRHGERGSWMMHAWLTGDLAATFAQCAPFNALNAHNPLLAYERYRPDIPGVDEPCEDTVGYAQ
jgi:hypothetical protein